MARVTIYLDAELAEQMRQAAATAGLSPSRWLAQLVAEKLRHEWPPSVAALAGAWADFPETEELRRDLGTDAGREPL